VRALDTNVIVRFLVRDDERQAGRARRLLEDAEESGERYLVTRVVMLETIWVLSAVYGLSRDEVLDAVELLSQLAVLELEDHDAAMELVRLGRATGTHLPDLVIGLAGKSCGCDTTLTLEKGLEPTGLFERL